MPNLIPLKFQPGINREVTSYSNAGGWWDCDKIRFRSGHPETIGGWVRYTNAPFIGVCSNLFAWANLTSDTHIGIGTTSKYNVYFAGTLYDITPVRLTTSAGAVTFAATNGSDVLTVTHTGHGAAVGSYVTFSGAASLGGVIVSGELNKEFQVQSIIDSGNYTVQLSIPANASDTGDGGASVVGAYQINPGLSSTTFGTGYGVSPYGEGGYGDPATGATITLSLRTWSHDNFGEDLIINPRDGNIYYWDMSSGLSARAIPLSQLPGAANAPTVATRVLVSDRDRHVIAFGCDPELNVGVQDPLVIRFSAQENAADWRTRTTNTAGELRISGGTKIVSALQTSREIVVFTDSSLYVMQFIGPPFTFGINEVAQNIQIVGPNAAIAANDVVYWMASGKFMIYDGAARELPCTVKEYVFSNLNELQRDKVTAGHNSRFSEVWWFYPAESEENSRYVIFNYEMNAWYIGTMERTAWMDLGIVASPLAASMDGYIYEHEVGLNDGSTNPSSAMSSFIESSDQEIAAGDSFMFATRVIPDITFRNSTGMPSVTMTIKARDFPGGTFTQEYPNNVSQSAVVPVEQHTRQVFIRLRGRAYSIRIEGNAENGAWRLGTPRIDVRTDGRR